MPMIHKYITDDARLKAFTDFVAMERLAGGPSPNVKLVKSAATADGVNREELAWRACCYASIYNTPSAAALWTAWPLRRIRRLKGIDELIHWLTEHKAGLPVHSNRIRTTGSPKRLAECMLATLELVSSNELEIGDDFDRLWSQVTNVKKVGRYFGIKFAGTLHRLGITAAEQYDIRAKGAKNGRKSLGLMFPQVAGTVGDHKNNSKAVLLEAESLARRVKTYLEYRHGQKTRWFELEALLCEFNQCVKGNRYPGKTSDSDMGALNRVVAHFGKDGPGVSSVLAARSEVLPAWAMSTVKRPELLDVYSRLGYMWSDAIYDHGKTVDLENPVLASTAESCGWQPLTYPPVRSKR